MTTSTAAVATDLVLAELRGPVLLLTVNGPGRLNSWTDALEELYFASTRSRRTRTSGPLS